MLFQYNQQKHVIYLWPFYEWHFPCDNPADLSLDKNIGIFLLTHKPQCDAQSRV